MLYLLRNLVTAGMISLTMMLPVLSKTNFIPTHIKRSSKTSGVPDGGRLMRAPSRTIWSEGIFSISVLIEEQAAIANKYIEPKVNKLNGRHFMPVTKGIRT
jgi:hypothetical protein